MEAVLGIMGVVDSITGQLIKEYKTALKNKNKKINDFIVI